MNAGFLTERTGMKQTLLLVDDDADFLEELGEVLSLSGYRTVAVCDPRQVLEVARREVPALILMDLKMPEKSGFELAYDLKREPELSGIPIIAMSGVFPAQVVSLRGLSGFRKCLPKPFNPLDAIWMIEKILVEGKNKQTV